MLQNSCVRFVCGIRRRDHVTGARKSLGWLDMEETRFLHACCLYQKIITTNSPTYLMEHIKYRTSVHNVDTRTKGMLEIPMHTKETYKRSFSYHIVSTYNKINIDFKKLNMDKFKICMFQELVTGSMSNFS